MNRLLIIDDDTNFCEVISCHLASKKWKITIAHRGDEAIRICSSEKIDVVLLDQRLPDGPGINLCSSILAFNDQAKIIFITAYPNIDNAIEAIKKGAHDYIIKPFKLEILEMAITKAFGAIKLERMDQVQQYNKKKECEAIQLIGFNRGLKHVQKMIELAAYNDAPVLLTGETGTGKSLIAKHIHCYGGRREEVFITTNCASFPHNLMEAELFGYEKGAFTGATNAKKGIFEMADGGTLLLDEIGEIPIHLQSKLLGVLDDKKVRRIGSEKVRYIDARIVAATNIKLEEAVTQNQFRKDLYYRLGVIRIHVPPLRERKEDIVDLAYFFIQQLDTSKEADFGPGEMERLMNYQWPGNIRELKNVIERSLILRKGNQIEPSRLLGHDDPPCDTLYPSGMFSHRICDAELPEDLPPLKDIEAIYIRHVLKEKKNNYSATAKALQISRSTLLRKLKCFAGQ